MKVPRHVGCNGVESARLEFEQTVAPVLARNAEVVHFARKNAERFAVEEKLFILDFSFHRLPFSDKSVSSSARRM